MNYRDADNACFEIIEAEMPALFTNPGTTRFPLTYRAFLGFCTKTNSLKTALFDMVESNNPYAFNALFRCLCEHYLKFLYIFARFTKDNTDAAGKEYFSFCGAVEARDYANAIQLAEALLGNDLVGNVDSAVAQLYPIADGLSYRELEAASNQFKYRAILRFFQKEVPAMITAQRPFLATIVPQYALLSSFVHGGPYTDMELYSYADPTALAECEERAEIAFLMAASVFMMSAAAVSREHYQHAAVAGRVKAVIDCITHAHDET